MKGIALILLVFMVIISTAQGNAEPVANNAKMECCHHMPQAPLKQNSKKACDGGMCVTMLSCGNCCFLKTEALSLTDVAGVFKVKNATPYLLGNLPGYAISCWNPPQV